MYQTLNADRRTDHSATKLCGLPFIFLCLILYSILFLVHSSATASQNTDRDFSLAISGGLSLGAYEAGLNWSIINYQKAKGKNFRSVTGASAGAVNALLSAISWCVDDQLAQSQRQKINQIMGRPDYDFNSVDNNLLREVWLHAGFDALLPADQENNKHYLREDALLTRYAFRQAINKIVRLSHLKIFSDCDIPMGLVVTRVTPLALKIKNVEINSSRMVIPLLLRSNSDHGLEFHSLLLPEQEKRFGSLIYLPSLDPNVQTIKPKHEQTVLYPVGLKSVITAVLTSSAFPVVFGRVNLAHCQAGKYGELRVNLDPKHFDHHALNSFQAEELASNQYHCPQGLALVKAEFIDGGAFDNLPLGLSVHLNEVRKPALTKTKPINSVRYYYMDPNNLRPEGKKDRSQEELDFSYDTEIMSFDLIEQIRFLLGSSKASSDYELYNSFRWDPISIEDLFLTTRYGPLTGKYWAHLGAFIDYAFREYDYYVGVYDGIIALAQQQCATPVEKTEAKNSCLLERFFELQHSLSASGSTKMSFMTRLLLSYEYQADLQKLKRLTTLVSAMPGPECLKAQNPCHLTTELQNQLLKLTLIHKGLTHTDNANRQARFSHFIHTLNNNHYPRDNNESTLNHILDNVDRDPMTWYRPLVNRASHRLIKLENSDLYQRHQNIPKPSEAKKGSQLVTQENDDVFSILKPVAKISVFFTAVSANTLVGTSNEFSFTQSSAPSPGWWALLPYELGVDVRNGGMIAAWEPSWNVARNQYLNLRIMPYDNNRFGDHDVYTSQVDFIYKYRTGFALSSFALAPTWTRTYKDWGGKTRRNNVGAALHLGFLADKLRVSIGTRSFNSDYFPGNSFYISLSLTDVPGMSYWAHKTYASSPGSIEPSPQAFFP